MLIIQPERSIQLLINNPGSIYSGGLKSSLSSENIIQLLCMKLIILISLMLITGCGKNKDEIKSEKNASPGKDSSAVRNNEISQSENKTDSFPDSNPGAGLGYVQYGIRKLPGEIEYTGSVISMAQWKDRLGLNILFITETAENSNEDTRSKELFAYHFLDDDPGSRLLWKINDFVKDCPVDLTLNYIDKSLTITDLNNNGIAESGFLYRMSCKGDVSADDMKFIMHEGDKKYAIRGSMNLEMNGEELEKGRMELDPSFKSAPKKFLEFAESQWNKYKTDKIGN